MRKKRKPRERKETAFFFLRKKEKPWGKRKKRNLKIAGTIAGLVLTAITGLGIKDYKWKHSIEYSKQQVLKLTPEDPAFNPAVVELGKRIANDKLPTEIDGNQVYFGTRNGKVIPLDPSSLHSKRDLISL